LNENGQAHRPARRKRGKPGRRIPSFARTSARKGPRQWKTRPSRGWGEAAISSDVACELSSRSCPYLTPFLFTRFRRHHSGRAVRGCGWPAVPARHESKSAQGLSASQVSPKARGIAHFPVDPTQTAGESRARTSVARLSHRRLRHAGETASPLRSMRLRRMAGQHRRFPALQVLVPETPRQVVPAAQSMLPVC